MATAKPVTIALACLCCAMATGEHALSAQSPTFRVGRAARPDEIAAIDIDVRPDGQGLPVGSVTAVDGKPVYAFRCVTCHGASGREGPQDILVGGRESLLTPKPSKTVGSYWPSGTPLWDYVRRAMPFDHPGTLPVDDVYSVTAYVLYLNDILGERDVMDQTTLPKVKMPNRDGFVRDPRPDTGAVKPAARSSRKR